MRASAAWTIPEAKGGWRICPISADAVAETAAGLLCAPGTPGD